MKKFVCIHGHFYQPPRENPWTGEVDREESAQPFHDWNERINEECYKANTQAAILDPHGKIAKHFNNFERMSFDLGPTLLSWLKRKDPATYQAILAADKKSAGRLWGHGNAMAQVYNHLIMPLANKRDKITQIIWGIKDFEYHYKRKPEGMWLSETAVDMQTLNLLANHGIKFTVLAPHQAKRVRHLGFGSRWQAVQNHSVDPKHAYRVLLDWGRHFYVFFYDAPISQAIAFQGLLSNGDELVHRMMSAYGHRDREQLVSAATDGESYGHHHKFGDMALAYSFKKIEDGRLASITNYAAFLNQGSTFWEAEIHENSSWSCAHGIERWRSDCGCRIHHAHGWNQKWRVYLREAMDKLHEVVDEVFEKELGPLLKDPWQARNQYVEILLESDDTTRRKFLERNAKKRLDADETRKVWELLEAEKFSLFSYTSCGWFFDDISGIEATQVLKFALRALELVQPYYPRDIEGFFVKILASAHSNYSKFGTGADVFNRFVKAARPDTISK